MFYIQQNEKIVLFDENKETLQNTLAFMPQYESLEIKEVEEGYVIYDFKLMTVEEMEEKEVQKERERLNNLSMTKREMFLGLYQAKGITPDMLKAQITDPQALIEFEYANDYYRGNTLIDIIGGQLGFTSDMLDKFFDSKDYRYLTTCTLTVNALPEEATVYLNEIEQNTITVPYGSKVSVEVSLQGYEPYFNIFELTEDRTLDIGLVKEVTNEDTTGDNESDVPNELDTTISEPDETDTDNVE